MSLYVYEESYRGPNNTYTSDLDKLLEDEPRASLVNAWDVVFEEANASHFRAR